MARRVLFWLALALLALIAVAAWRSLPRAWWHESELTRQGEDGEVPPALEATGIPPRIDGEPRLEGTGREVRRAHVTVRVRGARGGPLVGLPVRVLSREADPEVLITDVSGEVEVRDCPLDGRVVVQVPEEEPQTVCAPLVVLQSRLGLPCDLLFLDAETGREVPGIGWTAVHAAEEPFAPRSLLAPRFRSGRQELAVRPGVPRSRPIWRFRPPAGYTEWPLRDVPGTLSRYALRLEARLPLYREVDLEVRVLDVPPGGFEDLDVEACVILPPRSRPEELDPNDAPPVGSTWEPIGPDRVRLRGVPLVPRARVHIAAETYVRAEDAVIDWYVCSARPTLESVMRVELRFGSEPTEKTLDGLKFTDWLGHSTIGIGGGRVRGAPPPPGTLRIRALRRDGRQAAQAAYAVTACLGRPAVDAEPRGRLDDQGRATLEVPEGLCRIRIAEPGLVPMAVELRIVRGETHEALLSEPEGADLLVRVVDGGKKPIPFAEVEVRAWPWVDLSDDGVQRLDSFVGERGERLLRRLPADREITVKATWLGLEAQASLQLEESERRTVVLTLE